MTKQQKVTLTVIAAILLDLILAGLFARYTRHGFGTSVYWALGAATTEGSSIPEISGAAQLLKSLVETIDLPLWLGVFSLYTSWLTVEHVSKRITAAELNLKTHLEQHLENRLQHYHNLSNGKDHHCEQDTGRDTPVAG